MTTVNKEIKKIIGQVKEVQGQLHTMIKNQNWLEEARKYAEKQGKEAKKLFAPDVDKIKSFLERERKELEKIQKQIPTEVKKLGKFVDLQKKEFEKLLVRVRKLPQAQTSGKGKKKAKKTTKSASGKKSQTAGRARKSGSTKASAGASSPSANA